MGITLYRLAVGWTIAFTFSGSPQPFWPSRSLVLVITTWIHTSQVSWLSSHTTPLLADQLPVDSTFVSYLCDILSQVSMWSSLFYGQYTQIQGDKPKSIHLNGHTLSCLFRILLFVIVFCSYMSAVPCHVLFLLCCTSLYPARLPCPTFLSIVLSAFPSHSARIVH